MDWIRIGFEWTDSTLAVAWSVAAVVEIFRQLDSSIVLSPETVSKYPGKSNRPRRPEAK
jgi:hypothetical protein